MKSSDHIVTLHTYYNIILYIWYNSFPCTRGVHININYNLPTCLLSTLNFPRCLHVLFRIRFKCFRLKITIARWESIHMPYVSHHIFLIRYNSKSRDKCEMIWIIFSAAYPIWVTYRFSINSSGRRGLG